MNTRRCQYNCERCIFALTFEDPDDKAWEREYERVKKNDGLGFQEPLITLCYLPDGETCRQGFDRRRLRDTYRNVFIEKQADRETLLDVECIENDIKGALRGIAEGRGEDTEHITGSNTWLEVYLLAYEKKTGTKYELPTTQNQERKSVARL